MQSSYRFFVVPLAFLTCAALFPALASAQSVTGTLTSPSTVARRARIVLEPSSGGPGTEVAVGGDFAALSTLYSPEDVRATNNEVEDEQFFWGRCQAIGVNYALFRVDQTNRFAQPKEVSLTFGNGTEFLVPSLDGVVFYPEPVWAWSAPPAAPEIVSGDPFQAEQIFVDEPCGDPSTTIRQPFELFPDGCLHAQLPGTDACIGDRLGVDVFFETNLGEFAVTVPLTTPLVAHSPWSIAGFYIAFPLGTALTVAVSSCTATLDPIERQIVICPNAGVTILNVSTLSGVTIELDPLHHTMFTAMKGDDDDFYTDPIDPNMNLYDQVLPSPEFDLAAPTGTNSANGGRRNYDDGNTCDRFLVDTVDPLGVALLGQGDMGTMLFDGPIRSAVVEVHIRGYGCQTDTDAIHLGWDGVTPGPSLTEWGRNMISLAALSFQWQPNDDATLCFDLTALPRADGSMQSILDIVSLRDALDLIIQDDTMVDYVELKVLRCNP